MITQQEVSSGTMILSRICVMGVSSMVTVSLYPIMGSVGRCIMHRIIYAVVIADNANDAVGMAEDIFNGLCGGGGEPFESYEIGPRTKLTRVCRADSVKGRVLLERAMTQQKEVFMYALKKMRELVATVEDEDLWLYSSYPDLDLGIRHIAFELSMHNSSTVLYAEHGERIETPRDLEDVLSKWKCNYAGRDNPYKDMDVYVIPALAHH